MIRYPSQSTRQGLSMLETTLATVLVSLTLVASLNSLAFVLTTTGRDAQTLQASQIAQTVLAEIASRPFLDPTNTSTSIGLDAGETSDRATWDDCDDYHNWSTSTIDDRYGQVLPGASGWGLQVQVHYCDPSNPVIKAGSSSGFKCIELVLVSPSARQFKYYALRAERGVLTSQQAAGSSVLAAVDLSLQVEGKSSTTSTRLHNQQEPN